MTVGSKVKQTLADLRGSHGTMKLYWARSGDEGTKAVFNQALVDTEGIIKDLEDRLRVLESQEPQYKGN